MYTFFAGFHRKPIVNGYSGYFPQNYVRLVARLAPLPSDPDDWPALLGSGATHAVVHEAAINGAAISVWLRRHGAADVAVRDTDRMFRLR